MKYNYGPEGIVKPIEANEFWNRFSNHHPIKIDSCQIIGKRLEDYDLREISKYTGKKKTCMLGGIIFIYDDFSYVVEHNHWEKTQTYWKVAKCHHKDIEVGVARARELGVSHFGNCYHVYECEKCHRAYGVDSSG